MSASSHPAGTRERKIRRTIANGHVVGLPREDHREPVAIVELVGFGLVVERVNDEREAMVAWLQTNPVPEPVP